MARLMPGHLPFPAAGRDYRWAAARQLPESQIRWKAALESFETAGRSDTAPKLMVDTGDLASGTPPHPRKSSRIGGTDHDKDPVMPSSPDLTWSADEWPQPGPQMPSSAGSPLRSGSSSYGL
jgi:hypothetical protein